MWVARTLEWQDDRVQLSVLQEVGLRACSTKSLKGQVEQPNAQWTNGRDRKARKMSFIHSIEPVLVTLHTWWSCDLQGGCIICVHVL